MKPRNEQMLFWHMQINTILYWSRNAFLFTGLLALSYVGFVLLDAWLYQTEQARIFEEEMKENIALRTESFGIALSEGSTLGRIEIYSVGLRAMILEGIDEVTLQRGVGHIPGTPFPGQRGNIVLAGHRDTFFRGLRKIRVNDEITLTTLSGSYRYSVDSTKIVNPDETEVLKNGDDDILTLVTCYPFNVIGYAPKRFIVRAHVIPE